MAALFRRRRTGKGQFIEVAMRDGLTQLIGEHVLDYTLNQRVQSRSGNLQASMAPHGVFPCRGQDRWLAVAIRDDADWTAFCRAIGRSDLVADPDFATILARKRNEARLNEVVAAWTRTMDVGQAFEMLQAAGVPAAPAMTTEDIANDPQFLHRQAFQDVPLADGTKARLQRAAWRASATQLNIRRGPSYSEHTVSVLRDLLGMNAAEIERLALAGAIVLPPEEDAK